MNDFIALFRQIATEHVASGLAMAKAEVQSYDKDDATAVVKFMPHNVPSGDLQILTPWAGSPGKTSGMQVGLTPGTLVWIVSFDMEGEDLYIAGSAHSDKNKAPGAPAGEFWLVHDDPESYVKLKNDGKTDIGGKVATRLTAPLVELSDSLDALGDPDKIVRVEDLQKLVDWCNQTLVPWLTAAPYLGNFGMPVAPNPATLSNIATHPAPAATGSSVAKAKGD